MILPHHRYRLTTEKGSLFKDNLLQGGKTDRALLVTELKATSLEKQLRVCLPDGAIFRRMLISHHRPIGSPLLAHTVITIEMSRVLRFAVHGWGGHTFIWVLWRRTPVLHPFHVWLGRRLHWVFVEIIGIGVLVWVILLLRRKRRERRQRSTCDRCVGLDTTGGQGQLHQPFTQWANMPLLEVLESFILMDLPRAHSLNCGPPFSPHLLIGYPRYIKCCPNTGMLLAPEILRLDFGFLIGREVFTVLKSWRELLLHDAVVHLNLLALGLLSGSMSHKLMVLGAQPVILRHWTPTVVERGCISCGLLM